MGLGIGLHGVIPAFETGTEVSLASPRVFLALFGCLS